MAIFVYDARKQGFLMVYALPTADQLQLMFPAFASVDDAVVDTWIAFAATQVDQSWLDETNYQMGVMLLACHYMVGVGLGTGAQAEAAAAGMSSYQTIRSGQLSLSQGSSSQSGDVPSPWGTTWYGVQWYWLAKRNRPAVAVAVGPAVVGDIPSPYLFPGYPWGGGGFR